MKECIPIDCYNTIIKTNSVNQLTAHPYSLPLNFTMFERSDTLEYVNSILRYNSIDCMQIERGTFHLC